MKTNRLLMLFKDYEEPAVCVVIRSQLSLSTATKEVAMVIYTVHSLHDYKVIVDQKKLY